MLSSKEILKSIMVKLFGQIKLKLSLYAKKYKQLPEATLTRPATQVFNELLKYEKTFMGCLTIFNLKNIKLNNLIILKIVLG